LDSFVTGEVARALAARSEAQPVNLDGRRDLQAALDHDQAQLVTLTRRRFVETGDLAVGDQEYRAAKQLLDARIAMTRQELERLISPGQGAVPAWSTQLAEALAKGSGPGYQRELWQVLIERVEVRKAPCEPGTGRAVGYRVFDPARVTIVWREPYRRAVENAPTWRTTLGALARSATGRWAASAALALAREGDEGTPRPPIATTAGLYAHVATWTRKQPTKRRTTPSGPPAHKTTTAASSWHIFVPCRGWRGAELSGWGMVSPNAPRRSRTLVDGAGGALGMLLIMYEGRLPLTVGTNVVCQNGETMVVNVPGRLPGSGTSIAGPVRSVVQVIGASVGDDTISATNHLFW
jgi:hypothetical protein